MSIDIVHKCCICEDDFWPGSLDSSGKCSSCAKAFPTVKSKKEAMALNHPEINLDDKLTVEKVRHIIKEELNAFKAEQKVEQDKIDRMAKARAAKLDKKDDEAKEGDEI